MLRLYIFLVTLFLFNSNLIHAQQKLCPDPTNKKALKLFDEAKDARKKPGNYKEVKSILEEALDIDSTYAEAWKLLADAAYINKDYKTAEHAYEMSIAACADIGSNPYYRLGTLRYNKKNYKEAIKSLESFLDFDKINEDDAKDARELIGKSKLLMNPVPFNPKPLIGVSTPDPEYLACISPDGDYCFFHQVKCMAEIPRIHCLLSC